MREGKKINNTIFYYSYSLIDFFLQKSCYGFSKKLLMLFSKRLESRVFKKLNDLKTSKTYFITHILYDIVPLDLNLEDKVNVNIFMLDVINTYRGARHAFGLPVRGQRTWTNARSCYRSNLLLRQFRLRILKRISISSPDSELNTNYYAEAVNNLWKVQWEAEWRKAKRQRLIQAKKNRNTGQVDLKAIASGNVKVKGKKQKKTYLIGFDPGFTKYLLKQSIKYKQKKLKSKTKK